MGDDRLVHGFADARQVEDRLGQDGAGKEGADLQADDRDDRQHGVGDPVGADDLAFAEALRAGGPDVVEVQDVEQA